MSLDVDWSLLTSLPTHPLDPLSSTLIEILNRQLATTSRPSFIGPITVTSFDFGVVGPEVEIKDIRDVWRAFDEGDDEAEGVLDVRLEGNEEGDEWEGEGEGEEGYEMVSPDEWDEGSVYSMSGRSRGSIVAAAVGIGVGGRDYLSPGPELSHFSQSHRRRTSQPRHRHRVHVKRDTSTSPSNSIPSLQLHLHLTHTSDLHLTLLTSLQINYPSPLFMSLPLKLIITGLTLSGDVVLAYSGEKHRIHLCVVDEADDTGQGMGLGQRLLPNLQIESEIGHADAHVLRNVGKVERFIADVIRKTLVDELVFPNFHTIAL